MLRVVTTIRNHASHVHLPLNRPSLPEISPQEFKDGMAKLGFSIAVVTARHADERLGRTVTSLMPLSAEPPQMMVSIDVRSRLIDVIGLSRRFSISLLAAGQGHIGDTFAGKGNQEERFPLADWDYWPSGNPKLANAVVSIDCELAGSIDVGDHMLFVGVIVETDTRLDLQPLLWNERSYRAMRTGPD